MAYDELQIEREQQRLKHNIQYFRQKLKSLELEGDFADNPALNQI